MPNGRALALAGRAIIGAAAADDDALHAAGAGGAAALTMSDLELRMGGAGFAAGAKVVDYAGAFIFYSQI